ncbi:MAG: phage portal protein, partial [Armatimonadetes bacterium]|nr:phage portal protein [Armatimonadota bacterium]
MGNPLAIIGAEVKALARIGGPLDVFQRFGTTSNQLSITNGAYLTGDTLVAQSAAPDYEKLVGDPLRNGVVAACVNAVAKALPDAPLVLERWDGKGWQTVTDHECLEPLRAPNADHSDADVWALTSGHKSVYGQAFWLILPDKLQRAREIHVWHPSRVEVHGTESEFISGYRLQREGGGIISPDYPKTQVIHFRHLPDFSNPR